MIKTLFFSAGIVFGSLSAGSVGTFVGVVLAGKGPQLVAELSELLRSFV